MPSTVVPEWVAHPEKSSLHKLKASLKTTPHYRIVDSGQPIRGGLPRVPDAAAVTSKLIGDLPASPKYYTKLFFPYKSGFNAHTLFQYQTPKCKSGRFDFQGFINPHTDPVTHQLVHDYNFQVQIDTSTTAAVLVDGAAIARGIQVPAEQIYIARQIAGALRLSSQSSHIYRLTAVQLVFRDTDGESLGDGAAQPFIPHPAVIYLGSSANEDYINKVDSMMEKANHALSVAVDAMNTKHAASNAVLPEGIQTLLPFLGCSADLLAVNPTNIAGSLKRINALSFDDTGAGTLYSFYPNPISSLDYSIKGMDSKSEFKNEFKASVSAGGEYDGIGGSLSTEYKQMFDNKSEASSVHSSSSINVNLGDLTLTVRPYRCGDHISDDLRDTVESIDVNDKAAIAAFVARFGTHFVDGFTAGGRGTQLLSVQSNEISKLFSSETSVSAALKVFFFNSTAGMSSSSSTTISTFNSNQRGSVSLFGGNQIPSPPHDPKIPTDYSTWAGSVPQAPVITAVSLRCLSDILVKENFSKLSDADTKLPALVSHIQDYLESTGTATKNVVPSQLYGLESFLPNGRVSLAKMDDKTMMTMDFSPVDVPKTMDAITGPCRLYPAPSAWMQYTPSSTAVMSKAQIEQMKKVTAISIADYSAIKTFTGYTLYNILRDPPKVGDPLVDGGYVVGPAGASQFIPVFPENVTVDDPDSNVLTEDRCFLVWTCRFYYSDNYYMLQVRGLEYSTFRFFSIPGTETFPDF